MTHSQEKYIDANHPQGSPNIRLTRKKKKVNTTLLFMFKRIKENQVKELRSVK